MYAVEEGLETEEDVDKLVTQICYRAASSRRSSAPKSRGVSLDNGLPKWEAGAGGRSPVRIISKRKLREFWENRPDAKEPLLDWYNVALKSSWQNLAEVRESFRHADPVGDCTVFNIKGNDYRLITVIKYRAQRVYALYVLTHKEYDKEKWKDDCHC